MGDGVENLFDKNLKTVINALQQGADNQTIAHLIQSFHSSEVALLIESVLPEYRLRLWKGLSDNKEGVTLSALSEEVQSEIINKMSIDELVSATRDLDLDDLADIIPNLPESALHNVLLTLDINRRNHLAQVLSYAEDSAGGLMDTNIITVRADVSVRSVLRYLRLLKKMPLDTDQIFVVDRKDKLLGSIYLSTLVTRDPKQDIKGIIQPAENAILATTKDKEVAALFAARNLISAPVVNDKGQIIGRVTIDDVVDVIRAQAEHSVLSMAGLDEEDDLFAPAVESARRRTLWLSINLITAFIAVFVISLFEATLEKKIALAILMPVVASMGGIAGMQTLILFTRGIATAKISKANIRWLFNKEIFIGLLNSVIWSFIIASVTYLWFFDLPLSLVIGFAVIVNLVFATLSGIFLPLILTKLKIDPALAGGVVLTTLTDVIGFAVFLGLATFLL